MEGETRAHLNYLEQLYKFHRQTGAAISNVPILDRKPVNLHSLKKLVAAAGGYEKVTLERKWTNIGHQLGYSDALVTSLATSLKGIYAKIIWPYENYLANRTPTPSPFGTPVSKNISNGNGVQASPLAGDGVQASPLAGNGAQASPQADYNGTNSSPAVKRESEADMDTESSNPRPVRAPTRMSSGRPTDRLVTPPPHGTIRMAPPKATTAVGEEALCEICGGGEDDINMLLCDECDRGTHLYCLNPPLAAIPKSDWYCDKCLVATGGDFGFDEGEEYSLAEFKKKADGFKQKWFSERGKDPKTQQLKDIEVEREFWRLVESVHETVEVEYGADVHSSTHGSGFPTIEKNPTDAYSTDGWNLNVMPVLPESLFCHIKSDISGMTVPWVYVGMCFSTFCWHNEDHYTYSINYQHWGDTKTWYGIPGDHAHKFEETMKAAVPELFEQQPDLLFQLVTIMSPKRLVKEGVKVYGTDQKPNQFVITFPQAYHAGFNHGFNFNEAVNFTLGDWAPYGLACVERYKHFRKMPVFSHDELLITAALSDNSVKTALWLKDALADLEKREISKRNAFRAKHPEIPEILEEVDRPEEEYQCRVCKVYCYLSHVTCHCTLKVVCFDHIDELCNKHVEANGGVPTSHKVALRSRYSDEQIADLATKVYDRATLPAAWRDKLSRAMSEHGSRPPLRVLRSLLSEAERIPYPIEEAVELKKFVEKANGWVEEATGLLVRKHGKRKSEGRHPRRKSGRGEDPPDDDDVASNADPTEGKRKPEEIDRLLRTAKRLPFDAPEIEMLQETKQAVEDFRTAARSVLSDSNATLQACKEARDAGSGILNVYVQEAALLDNHIAKLEWQKNANEVEDLTLLEMSDLEELIDDGKKCGLTVENDEKMAILTIHLQRGQRWRDEVQALLSKDNGYTLAELEAVMKNAADVPLDRETYTKSQSALTRSADWIASVEKLKEKSVDSDIAKRPDITEGRRALKLLDNLSLNEPMLVDWLKEKVNESNAFEAVAKELFMAGKDGGRILSQVLQEVFERIANAAALDDSQHSVEPGEPEEIVPAERDEEKQATSQMDLDDKPSELSTAVATSLPEASADNDSITVIEAPVTMPIDVASQKPSVDKSPAATREILSDSQEAPTTDSKVTADVSMEVDEVDDTAPFYRRYCLCRMPESGLMVECEVCHEWYHSSCMRVSKKKAKQNLGYLCPVCDSSLDVPRVAGMKRPPLDKVRTLLANLQALALPLYTETAHLYDIVKVVSELEQKLNDYLSQHSQVAYTTEDVSELKFYLRKLEGMDVQLKSQRDFIRAKVDELAPHKPKEIVERQESVPASGPATAPLPPQKKWNFVEEKPVYDAAGERLYCLCHRSAPPKPASTESEAVVTSKVPAVEVVASGSVKMEDVAADAAPQANTEPPRIAESEAVVAAPSGSIPTKVEDEANQMIGCDVQTCGNWYHYACVGLDAQEADAIETYTCPGCSIRKDLPYKYADVVIIAKGAGRDGEVLLDKPMAGKEGSEPAQTKITMSLKLTKPRAKPAPKPIIAEAAKTLAESEAKPKKIKIKSDKSEITADGQPAATKKRKAEGEPEDEAKAALKAARRKMRKEKKDKSKDDEVSKLTAAAKGQVPPQFLPPTGTFSTGYVVPQQQQHQQDSMAPPRHLLPPPEFMQGPQGQQSYQPPPLPYYYNHGPPQQLPHHHLPPPPPSSQHRYSPYPPPPPMGSYGQNPHYPPPPPGHVRSLPPLNAERQNDGNASMPPRPPLPPQHWQQQQRGHHQGHHGHHYQPLQPQPPPTQHHQQQPPQQSQPPQQHNSSAADASKAT